MSRLGRAAARFALRLHPGAWRARYGVELIDLIHETDSSLADAADLARSAVREHANGGAPMRFEPAHRHRTAFAAGAAVLLAPTLVVVVLSAIGHELGVSAVAAAVDPVMVWISSVRVIDLALVLAPAAAFGLSMLPALDLRLERGLDGPALALRVLAAPANLAVAALSLLVGAALVAHIVVESVLHAGP